jgi:hypothetical protein
MPGLFYNADEVMVGIAALYLKAYDPTTPAVDFGKQAGGPFQAAPAGWISPGGTDQGYSLTTNTNTQDIQIEEQAAAVGTFVTSKTYQVAASLAQSNPVNRGLYYGGIVGTDEDGNTTITMSDEPQFYAYVLEYQDSDQNPVHLFVPKATVVGTGDVAFRRASAANLFGLQVTSSCTTNEIVETTYDAPAGG